MKSRLLGLLVLALLSAPLVSKAAVITIERISDTEALITGAGNLALFAPAANRNLLLLFDPFAVDPAPSARDSVFTASNMTVGSVAVDAAQEVGTNFAPFPFLILGSTTTDFAPFGSFAGSLHVTLGGSSTLLGVGNSGPVIWGTNSEPILIGNWQIVAPGAAPEPATLALLGLSLAGLAATRRRKQ